MRQTLVASVVILASLFASCSSRTITSEQSARVRSLASQRFSGAYDVVPSPENSYLLCKHKKKENIPLRPMDFFVYGAEADSIVYEGTIDFGDVGWHDDSTLEIERIPGAITVDGQMPIELYNLRTGTSTTRYR